MGRECQDKTDEEIAKLIGDDPDFYYCLIERYEEKMKRYVRRLSGVAKETAEDLVQEIFLKAYENINDFDTDLKFSSWLYRIAHNHSISFWRKNKNEKKVFSLDADENFKNLFESNEDVAKELEDKITRETVSRIISKLEVPCQEALALRYLEDKSYEEISDILQKPIGTVGTLIARAKAEFRQKLKKEKIKL
jgi:RNA polymerase sigma-70 factor (ECF subfamily)